MIAHRHSHDDELIFNMEDNITTAVMATATTPTNTLATPSTQTSLAVRSLLHTIIAVTGFSNMKIYFTFKMIGDRLEVTDLMS